MRKLFGFLYAKQKQAITKKRCYLLKKTKLEEGYAKKDEKNYFWKSI